MFASDDLRTWPILFFAQLLLLAVSLFWSPQCFVHLSYFILLLLLLAALHSGLSFRGLVRDKTGKYLPGVIGAALLTVVVAVSVKPMLRVTSDETNLISASYSLAFERKADMVQQSVWVNGEFIPVSRDYDKRPLAFPFLTSLGHTLTGPRYENGFVANWLVLFVLLVTVYWLSRQYMGAGASVAMQFLVLSHPVIAQAATSAGMDLTAAALLLLSVAGLKAFLDGPSAIRLQFFWFAAVSYFNSRYESPLFAFLLVLGLVIYAKDLPWRSFKFSWLWLTPLFLMPQLWQRLAYGFRKDVAWNGYEFSVSSIAANLKQCWLVLARPDPYYPYASELVVLGLASFAFYLVQSFKSPASLDRKEKLFSAICASVFFGLLLLTLAAFDTHPASPAASRLYLIPCIGLSLFAGGFLNGLLAKFRVPRLLLPVSAALFLFHHPVAVLNSFPSSYPNPRELRNTLQFLEKKDPRRFLLIAAWAPHYAALRYGSVNFEYLRANREWLRGRFNSRDIPEILVLQSIDPGTGDPTADTQLDENVRLEKVYEFPNVPAYFSRISRVVAL